MKRVITWIEASAGSGKTTEIVNRVNKLIKDSNSASSILCLSFTNAAADELKSRVNLEAARFETIHSFAMSIMLNSEKCVMINEQVHAKMIKDAIEMGLDEELEQLLKEVGIGLSSLHSIVQDYISDYYSTLPLAKLEQRLKDTVKPKKLQIELSEDEQRFLVEKNLGHLISIILSCDHELYLKYFFTIHCKLYESIVHRFSENESLKNKLNLISDYVAQCNEVRGITLSLRLNIALRKIADIYYRMIEAKNIMSYEDLLIKAAKNSDPAKFMNIKHVFVDEAQDVSASQMRFLISFFLDLVQHDEYSITIVGDKKQMIYTFNGSSEEVFKAIKLSLMNLARGTNSQWVEEELNISHRSGHVMLNFIDTMMHSTYYKSSHKCADPKSSKIVVWKQLNPCLSKQSIKWEVNSGQTVPAAVKLCIEKIKELKTQKLLNEDRLIEDSDITILIPKRCNASYILAYELIISGIKVSETPFIIPTNGVIEEFLYLIPLVLIQSDFSVVTILKGAFFQWTDEEIEEVCVNRGDVSVWAALNALKKEKAKAAVRIIKKWIKAPKDVFQFYAYVLFKTAYGEYFQKFLPEETNLFWAKVLQAKNLNIPLASFSDYIYNDVRSFKINKKGVSILTVHSAKGRENNIVFLFNSHLSPNSQQKSYLLYQGMFVVKGTYFSYRKAKNINNICQLKEAQRLMYVAITRAREQLYFLPPTQNENIAANSFYAKAVEICMKKGVFFDIDDISLCEIS